MKGFLKLFLLSSLLILVHLSEDADILILGNNKYCITNSTSAIIFNGDIGKIDDNAILVSNIYPPPASSRIECNFGDNGECQFYGLWKQDNWYEQNSLYTKAPEIITDRRWEKFPIRKTTGDLSKNLVYVEIFNSLTDNIDIALSIRIKQEAHIYLCDGHSPVNSNCYWIMLGSNSGTMSKIRKCKRGQISYKSNKYPDDPICKDGLNKTTVNPLDENEWKHFLIQKYQGALRVYHDNKIFLEISDPHLFYTPKRLFIHSKKVDGLWKIHYYKFFESLTKTAAQDQLGPSFRQSGEFCISLYVKTSFYSFLRIKIICNLFTLITKDVSTNGTWSEIKIHLNESLNSIYSLIFVKKLQTGESDDEAYWAIDDLRLCHGEEYRYIEYTDSDEQECQKISLRKQKTLSLNDQTKKSTSVNGINCPEDRFGTACVPCEIFGNQYCPKSLKYCQLDTDTCYCSAGYTGDRCKTVCSQGFYGQGCRHQGHCLEQYDPVTGECSTCEDPFEGTRCDTVSMPFFINKPKVYDIESTSFKIQQDELDVQGHGMDEYYFEYLNKDDPSSWQRANKENIPISKSPIITVNAEPDTDYEVRAIVLSSKQSRLINKNYSKYTIPVYTKCKKITQDEIQIQARNNSATITLQLSSGSCKISKYCYVINNSICNFFRLTVIEVPKLKPFSKNTIIFRHSNESVTIQFNTTEGAPSGVTAIKHAEFSNTIKLTWKDPVDKNGEIVAYEIKYRFVKNRACAEETQGTFSSENVTDKEITLDNLNPYSTYEIIITAFTNAYKGKSQQLFLETTAATELSDNEIITIDSMVPRKFESDLYMNEVLCNYITGPIKIQILIFCISEWCYGINNNYNWNYTRDHALLIPNLRPYTNYNFTLWISRDQKNWAYSDSKLTQTKPDVPLSVSDFNVYTKDENSISLRWRPPNPPTGILAEYEIQYISHYYNTYGPYYKRITVPETKCKLWNKFHCATIIKAVALGYIYDITITARNEDPITYGASSKIEITNVDEGPQPPYDLSYKWTENNELFIYWFHPNNTNGRLASFEILDQLSESDYYHIASEDDYKLHYKYKFPGIYKACEEFQLYVRAHNVHGMSTYMPVIINNPPIIPTIANENSYTSTNHTISVNVQFESQVQTVYIVVSNHDKTDDLALFEEGLRENQVLYNNLTTSRIVYEDTKLNSLIFEIGHENYTSKNWSNAPLDSGRQYCISVFLINKCNKNGMTRIKRIQKFVSTEGENTNIDKGATNGEETTNDGGGLWALLILILFPIAIGIWYARKKNIDFNKIVRPPSKTKSTDELPLTEKTPTINPRIHVVKPKPTIILPALQTKHSKKIPIIEFENYVKESIESGELERQHNLFPKGLIKPHNVGSLPANKNKNRYKNLIAYDHTRVKLKDYIKEENVGYINANYIDGYRKPRAYIATQGPKNNTLGDFWWMIWQENVKDIVMLANIHENGKKKVEKYWPDINEEKIYGLVKVQYVSETVFANFVLRVFNVQYKSDERKVSQMHYTTWPDHGVPLYSQSLVPYLQKLLKIPHNSQTPILVHCSAGVGRTGTIILSDICLRMAAGEGYLDFLAHLENLRSQRANLVDNIEQYKLAHLVVLECLFGMRTSIPCTDEMRSIVEVTLNNNGIKTQMKYILETQWQDMAMETMLENDEIAPIYNEKNRVKDIIPENYRVYITRYPHDDEKSSYINAVLVDDFANPGRYIVTQQPLPNTLGDFWRLVLERSCTEIISLNTINLDDESVCQIWPEKGEELSPVDFIKIIHKRTQRLNFYKVITVQLEVKQSKLSTLTDATMEVNIIALDNWRSEDLLPNSIEEFLAFRDAADAMARTSEYVIVTCYDGAKASGLYLAMSFLIEQMKLEQECDVCLAVRSIRHSRKQFVTTEEQYEFLYRAAVTFISGFQPYSNFS